MGSFGSTPTPELDVQRELAFALTLADIADPITLKHFRSQTLVIETKADRTEVTIADRSSEQAIRDHITAARPEHGVVGEEHGVSQSESATRWIIDPIDGTSNYVRGVPVWATLLGLEHDGEIVVGVVSAPAMGLRWWAGRGLGAFANGRPISVSKVQAIDDAFLSYSESSYWAERGTREGIDQLRANVGRERAFGDFWQHMLVAEGAIDIAAEAIVNVWDLAALQIIVEEAGGRFSDLAGARRCDGGSVLASNGLLHDEALARIGLRR